MRTETDEERTQRRLEVEARTVQLGVLMHKDVYSREHAQRCRVEVSYRERFGDDDHCGYWLVWVPEIDPEGLSDDEAWAAHPAQLARDKVHEWNEENRDYDYFSVDDVYAA